MPQLLDYSGPDDDDDDDEEQDDDDSDWLGLTWSEYYQLYLERRIAS